MGEIAEAMLDGTLCAGCGEYLGQDAGYPVYCSACPDPSAPPVNRGRKREPEGQSALPRFSPYNIPPRPGAIKCDHCPRYSPQPAHSVPSIMPQGMADHMRAKHPEKLKGADHGE